VFFEAKGRVMMRALFAAAVVLGTLSPATAMTGNQLLEHCERRPDLCHGFIVGAAGMFWYQMETVRPICFADGLTWGQIHDVVVNYLEDHPEANGQHALVVVTWALREAFDCPAAEGLSGTDRKRAENGRHGGAGGGLPSGP
jgi:hypothetical protein